MGTHQKRLQKISWRILVDNYKKFINTFLENDYKDVFFNELTSDKNQLIIRHDVDLDCELAYEMSNIEKDMGIKSSYFFLLTNESYNLLSDRNKKIVSKIKNNGHNISLHFDCSLYDDFRKGLKEEISIFESVFDVKLDIVSIHKPTDIFMEERNDIDFIGNTYEDKYFQNTSYHADSGGEFRYGNPLESDSFKRNDNIHLVVHPVWWTMDKILDVSVVDELLEKKNNRLKTHFKQTVKNYKEYVDV